MYIFLVFSHIIRGQQVFQALVVPPRRRWWHCSHKAKPYKVVIRLLTEARLQKAAFEKPFWYYWSWLASDSSRWEENYEQQTGRPRVNFPTEVGEGWFGSFPTSVFFFYAPSERPVLMAVEMKWLKDKNCSSTTVKLLDKCAICHFRPECFSKHGLHTSFHRHLYF